MLSSSVWSEEERERERDASSPSPTIPRRNLMSLSCLVPLDRTSSAWLTRRERMQIENAFLKWMEKKE